MPPLRHFRRSRRLSHKSPIAPHYDPGSVDTSHLSPPSPSVCTTSPSSPPSITTHLPFAPGSSHTRNRKEGHIPRPPNAFMVFRSWLWNTDNLKNIERDNRNVSRIAGRYWNELSDAERAPFRSMADEAKARHARLYPQYRYSPASQKKPKAPQRRSQRSTDAENEKCKKVADMLLGGLASRDLANFIGEQPTKAKFHKDPSSLGASSESLTPVPRNGPNSPAAPGLESLESGSNNQNSPLPLPSVSLPSQYLASHPILLAAEECLESLPPAAPLTSTPRLAYPLMEGFVPTDDIPFLSLDNGFGSMMVKMNEDDGISILFPSHLNPGAHTVLSCVKPEATSFVDSCVLGAHTTNVLLSPSTSLTDFEVESYSALDNTLLPLGSPVFSNPFEPSTLTTEHSALLGTLDQLFGQSISPLTPFFPTEIW